MGSDVLSKISPLRWWLYVLFRERKSVDGIPMTCTRGHWISTGLQSPYGGSIPRAASLWKGKSTPNHASEAIHEALRRPASTISSATTGNMAARAERDRLPPTGVY